MGLRLILLAVALATVECVNRDRLNAYPKPQEKFIEKKYLGDWYIQARLPSCSWVGSYDFTNHVSQYSKQPAGNVYLKETWRSTDCASAVLDLTPAEHPGIYQLLDPIGDVISSKSYIVATDYKTFAIKWGCVKAIGNTCVDPYVVVKTRKQEPSAHVWKVVEKLLNHLWELNLTEMVRVIHDDRACIKLNPYKKHSPHSHLLKKY